jgi:glycosyltransferase involved in cell wall biosynthesis
MEQKKSVLFVVSDFNLGGITTALRNLTDVLVREGHKVGIVNLPNAQSLPSNFNTNIELIPLSGKAMLWSFGIETVKKAPVVKKPFLLCLAVIKKFLNRINLWHSLVFSNTHIAGFDVAVAFRQSPLCYKFVKDHVLATRKIGFWHGDPDYMEGIDSWSYCLNYVDSIACVSDAVRDKMKARYPDRSEKMKTAYNIFNAEEIIQKSKEYDPEYSHDVFNIVTVSRIEFEQKQLDFIPEIASELKAKGLHFHWTIVGDGPDYDALKNLVSEHQLNGVVELVGSKSNRIRTLLMPIYLF